MGITTGKILDNIATRMNWSISDIYQRDNWYVIRTPDLYKVYFDDMTGKFYCKDAVMETLINKETEISYDILSKYY